MQHHHPSSVMHFNVHQCLHQDPDHGSSVHSNGRDWNVFHETGSVDASQPLPYMENPRLTLFLTTRDRDALRCLYGKSDVVEEFHRRLEEVPHEASVLSELIISLVERLKRVEETLQPLLEANTKHPIRSHGDHHHGDHPQGDHHHDDHHGEHRHARRQHQGHL